MKIYLVLSVLASLTAVLPYVCINCVLFSLFQFTLEVCLYHVLLFSNHNFAILSLDTT